MKIALLICLWLAVSFLVSMLFGRVVQQAYRRPLRGSHPDQFLNHHRFWRYT